MTYNWLGQLISVGFKEIIGNHEQDYFYIEHINMYMISIILKSKIIMSYIESNI